MTLSPNNNAKGRESRFFLHICRMKRRTLMFPLHERWMTYKVSGNWDSERPPLVLLHGLCEDHTIWDDIVPALEPHGLVFRIDLPGFGESELPDEAAPGMEGYIWALITLIFEFNMGRMALVGHSLGGYIALRAATQMWHMLNGMALIHSHPFRDTPERAEGRRRSIEILEQGHKERFVRQLFPSLFAPRFAQEHPEVVEKCIQMGLRQPTEGIITAMKAMLERWDHTGTLKWFQRPVMAVLGDEDKLVPVEDTRRAVEQARTHEVHVLKGVGHMSMFEAREALIEHLLRFWERLDISWPPLREDDPKPEYSQIVD